MKGYIRKLFDRADGAVPVINEIAIMCRVTGMSIGIIDGKHQKGFRLHGGWRDLTEKFIPNNHTRYQIDSLTMGMLATLVGAESFSSSGRRVHWLQLIQHWDNCKNLCKDSTILDCLSHRTGAESADEFWLGANNELVCQDRRKAFETFSSLQKACPFRSQAVHNKWGYEVVGQILETATDKSLSELFETRIFAPLKMKRTSTSWMDDEDDCNQAKSYSICSDHSWREIPRPSAGKGTVMEASVGVKSTLDDLLRYYSRFLKALVEQERFGSNETHNSPFKNCQEITSSHARLPGLPFPEQGYGIGWVRAKLPGRLGQFSTNAKLGVMPIVGKGGPSHVVLYQRGTAPGCSSGVWLVPERNIGIVILQNILTPVDTVDLVGQLLLETVLQTPEGLRNDYAALARELQTAASAYSDGVCGHLRELRSCSDRIPRLELYEGRYRYRDKPDAFFIDVKLAQDSQCTLQMRMQGMDSQPYNLRHLHNQTFTWFMSTSRMARAADYSYHPAAYYLVEFVRSGRGRGHEKAEAFKWSMGGNPDVKYVFVRDQTG